MSATRRRLSVSCPAPFVRFLARPGLRLRPFTRITERLALPHPVLHRRQCPVETCVVAPICSTLPASSCSPGTSCSLMRRTWSCTRVAVDAATFPRSAASGSGTVVCQRSRPVRWPTREAFKPLESWYRSKSQVLLVKNQTVTVRKPLLPENMPSSKG